jgi:hypothetical protein
MDPDAGHPAQAVGDGPRTLRTAVDDEARDVDFVRHQATSRGLVRRRRWRPRDMRGRIGAAGAGLRFDARARAAEGQDEPDRAVRAGVPAAHAGDAPGGQAARRDGGANPGRRSGRRGRAAEQQPAAADIRAPSGGALPGTTAAPFTPARRAGEQIVHPHREAPAGDRPDRDEGPDQEGEQQEDEKLERSPRSRRRSVRVPRLLACRRLPHPLDIGRGRQARLPSVQKPVPGRAGAAASSPLPLLCGKASRRSLREIKQRSRFGPSPGSGPKRLRCLISRKERRLAFPHSRGRGWKPRRLPVPGTGFLDRRERAWRPRPISSG